MGTRRRDCAARWVGSLAVAVLFAVSWMGSHAMEVQGADSPQAVAAPTSQMPVEDRLAEPVLPESPTQVDIGRNLYYFHCMPCHGDRGQGLTDEWREVWVEDHQNCWGRGCHTGRSHLAAFYIPRTIPAVIGSQQALDVFDTAEELFVFMRATQPPQRPGALADEEYWALTSFLLHENGRPLPDEGSGSDIPGGELALATLAPLLALLSVTWLAGRQTDPAP